MRLNLLSLLLGLIIPFSAYAVNPHQHSHETQLQLDHGKKLKTDQPLREGMEQIRSLVSTDPTDPTAFTKVSGEIEKQVQTIFKTCKLPPQEDAHLHIVIMQILDGSKKMKEAATLTGKRAALLKIAESLNSYGKHFDHPGWANLQLK